jgi:hypothetical protein
VHLRCGILVDWRHVTATRARDSSAYWGGRPDSENRFRIVRGSVAGGLFAVAAYLIEKERRSAVRIKVAICQTIENGSCILLSDAVECWHGRYAAIERVHYAICGGVSSSVGSEVRKARAARG